MTKSEGQTRSKLIDQQLAQSDWNVKDPTQVVEELDTRRAYAAFSVRLKSTKSCNSPSAWPRNSATEKTGEHPMESKAIQLMKSHFDALSHTSPEEGVEFWFARDLMEPLGYARWENFRTAIKRAIESCETTGHTAEDHFRGVTKMIEIGKGGQRPVDNFMLNFLKNSFLRGCKTVGLFDPITTGDAVQ
jgi:hypothetical protein